MDENDVDEQTINDFQEYLQKKYFGSKNEEQPNDNDNEENVVEEEKNEQKEKNEEKESEEDDFESYDESESDMSSYEDDEDENDKALMDSLYIAVKDFSRSTTPPSLSLF